MKYDYKRLRMKREELILQSYGVQILKPHVLSETVGDFFPNYCDSIIKPDTRPKTIYRINLKRRG